MMELAAFQTAWLVHLIEVKAADRRVLVLAGSGNNSGDAIATARLLQNWGAEISVFGPEKRNNITDHHFELLKKMDVSYFTDLEVFYHPDVVVDGIIGYSIKGGVRNPCVSWIDYINSTKATVYAIDIPSGLDLDDGSVHREAVKTNYTVTLVYPKRGLLHVYTKENVGKLYLVNIGIPDLVYKKLKKTWPALSYTNHSGEGPLVKIDL
jgi:NAD(P)H-hydrate epimerase